MKLLGMKSLSLDTSIDLGSLLSSSRGDQLRRARRQRRRARGVGLLGQTENFILRTFVIARKTRINIYRRIAKFMDNGVALQDAVVTLQEYYEMQRDQRHKIMLRWHLSMKHGETVLEMLQPWVPSAEAALIGAGSDANNVSAALREAADMAENQGKVLSAIINACTYPIVIITMIALMLVGFSVKMVPQLGEIMPPDQWTGNAALLYFISELITHHGYMLLVGIFFTVILVGWSMPRWRGEIRKRFDYVPPWSIYKLYQSASFLISTASMMGAGVDLDSALEKNYYAAGPWLRSKIGPMIAGLAEGSKPGDAMRNDLFDKETLCDIFVYGNQDDFNKQIKVIANETISSSTAMAKKLASTLNTMLLFVGGGCIGFIIMTVYNLTASISDKV